MLFQSFLLQAQIELIYLIQPLVKNLSKAHILSDALPIYRRLESDDQDSVRLLTVEDLITIAQQLTPAEVKEQLLKQVRHSIADKSWRVRYMAANHFNEVSSEGTHRLFNI
jgi:serine/threonine-protein phosphatase 2A regulatory subunit A